VKNLEEIYCQLLGNPIKGDLEDLERKYRAKVSELTAKQQAPKVDISTIQKNGEVNSAYLYLKTQWGMNRQRESGLIYEGVDCARNSTPGSSKQQKVNVDLLSRLHDRLRSIAKVGAGCVCLIFLYQVGSELLTNSDVIASVNRASNIENINSLIKDEVSMKKRIAKYRKIYNSNFRSIDRDLSERIPDSELISAAKACDVEGLKNALKSNSNINFSDSKGSNITHWLSRLNCASGLDWAIKNGADFSQKDESGRTAIDWARISNSYEAIRVLHQNTK